VSTNNFNPYQIVDTVQVLKNLKRVHEDYSSMEEVVIPGIFIKHTATIGLIL
jgi:hypothetical protein